MLSADSGACGLAVTATGHRLPLATPAPNNLTASVLAVSTDHLASAGIVPHLFGPPQSGQIVVNFPHVKGLERLLPVMIFSHLAKACVKVTVRDWRKDSLPDSYLTLHCRAVQW